jgi:hypothetical protein
MLTCTLPAAPRADHDHPRQAPAAAAAAASPGITVRGPSRAVVQLGMKAGRPPGDASLVSGVPSRFKSKLARANFEAGAAAPGGSPALSSCQSDCQKNVWQTEELARGMMVPCLGRPCVTWPMTSEITESSRIKKNGGDLVISNFHAYIHTFF